MGTPPVLAAAVSTRAIECDLGTLRPPPTALIKRPGLGGGKLPRELVTRPGAIAFNVGRSLWLVLWSVLD